MIALPPALIPLVGSLLLPLFPRRWRSALFLVFAGLTLGFLLLLEPGAQLGMPFLGYRLVVCRVDRLSLAFGYIFALITFLGGVYAFSLRDPGQQVSALLYAGASLGVVFAGDLFTLLVFWELQAVASVWLIWARQTRESATAGFRYLLIHLTGGGVLLAGILWQVTHTGSLLFDTFKPGVAGWLVLLAFSLNAAIPPLHAWLPDAYPEGTVTGSVFLSAFTTKTAVYALARGFAGWEVLVWAGTIMAVYGVIFAVLENDIRRILAYHIVSQVGYMVTGVGLGTEIAINGTTAHAFSHILYKALLFMGAGTVLYTTGRSKLTELGGLAHLMPVTLILYMVGAVSISGFPLFNGFISKSMVVYAAGVSHRPSVVLLLHLASVGTFLSVGLKLPYLTWFGPDRGLKPTPPAPGMYAGMALTAALCFGFGIYPSLLYRHLPYQPVDYQPYTVAHVVETGQLLLSTGLGFYLLRRKLRSEPTITLDTDWFYRAPARPLHAICVIWVDRLFNAAEGLTLRIAHFLADLGANPTGILSQGVRQALQGGAAPGPTEGPFPKGGRFNPDYSRLPVGIGLLLVLLVVTALLIWSQFLRDLP